MSLWDEESRFASFNRVKSPLYNGILGMFGASMVEPCLTCESVHLANTICMEVGFVHAVQVAYA